MNRRAQHKARGANEGKRREKGRVNRRARMLDFVNLGGRESENKKIVPDQFSGIPPQSKIKSRGEPAREEEDFCETEGDKRRAGLGRSPTC